MKEVNSSEVTSVEIAMGTLEGPPWVGPVELRPGCRCL
jgi:hypothetical protein